ncbi:MAG: chemotaxis protein CheW, partial [Deltaproteobacteria bacterium]|nr:chemotaxis protein CheW [Deltaproteobacteria bacterium]
IPGEDIEGAAQYLQEDTIHPHFLEGEAKAGDLIAMLLNAENLVRGEPLGLPVAGEEPLLTDYPSFCPLASPEEAAVFRARADNLRQKPVEAAFTGLASHAVFSIGGECFAVDTEYVTGFSDAANLTPVPCSPKHIVGNMNLRGNILTLVDIRGPLNMPIAPQPPKRVVVASIDGLSAGIAADEVFDCIYINQSGITHAPSVLPGGGDGGKYIRGVAPYRGGVMTVLNLKEILLGKELAVDEEV